ncbi:MAG: helix-turn-helix domain-containing protein [Saprospiraceae bacterium]|nr:helix-turn-helix domain-containing protein [Saprospiraceae bacterium]
MWWGYLMDTVLIYYLSISGYAQARIKTVRFAETPKNEDDFEENTALNQSIQHTDLLDTEGVNLAEMGAPNKIKNTLTDTDLSEWTVKLLHLFDIQKPYLNPELTLSDLATTMRTNSSILSQVINKGCGKNFNDFVNEYRVEAFKEKIKSADYQHLTLLAIAFDCGFNSKATFNRAFKKITGQNPSKF